jgi:hypothetical protein
MEKVEKLSTELAEMDEIDNITNGLHTVSFKTDYGKYNAIPTKVLELLAENEATLYDIDYKDRYDYIAVL